MTIIQRVFLGNTLQAWGVALLITIIVTVLFLIFKKVIINRLTGYAKKTETKLDDLITEVLSGTKIILLIPLALYLGLQVLTLPKGLEDLIENVTIVALLLQTAFWGNRIIVFWLSHKIERKTEQDAAKVTNLYVLGFISRVALWSIIVLLALDNLGFNITTLIAGLGIGGIAVALAAQNILGDLFASLSIILDKPFLIGDFIIVDDKLGTVEYIGIKTTRIRSLSGEQIVFSNTDILNSRIRNYKRMYERRVVFGLGVTYQTPLEKLARIQSYIREIIESQDKVRFDRAHFKEYGDFALIFEIVYYVRVPDYNAYMDTQQAINLAIFRRFQEEGIEFAYPTQSIYVYKES